MPRPCKRRRIWRDPKFTCFKPVGVPRRGIENIEIRIDEYEALRLFDHVGLNTQLAAQEMQISPPTFNRLLMSARKKLSEAIIKGKWIRIYKLDNTHDCD